MPYVKKELRVGVDLEIEKLVEVVLAAVPEDKPEALDGIANYVVSRLVNGVFKPSTGWRYHSMAHAVGCLEAVKLEMYRRLCGPYEDKAISENGDINEYKS